MKLLVSACLMGMRCRYDGGSDPLPRLDELMKEYTCIPVCPEMFGGLPTPRFPAERRKDQVINRGGEDVTDAFIQGTAEVLRLARLYDCKTALLKEHSPSCGSGEIYDGSFSGILVPGDGIAAQTLKRYGIAVYGESQLDELLHQDDLMLDTMMGLKTEIWQREKPEAEAAPTEETAAAPTEAPEQTAGFEAETGEEEGNPFGTIPAGWGVVPSQLDSTES